MKKIIYIIGTIIISLSASLYSYAQENNENNSTIDSIEKIFNDTIVTNPNEPIVKDTTQNITIDPAVKAIMDIIDEVNRRSLEINNIQSENEIFVNTKTVEEQEGSIEVRAKKPDEFWFRIWGSFLGISKDAFFGHFTREKFFYFNNLNDYTIQGPTTDKNVGYIVKVKSTFDDMMNVLTGTVNIPYTLTDTISMFDDKNNYYITIINKDYNRRYYIRKSDYTVTKYEYYNKRKQVEMSLSFSNFIRVGESNYAKLIEVKRPLQNETFRITNTIYRMNQSYLDFYIFVPNDPDIKKIIWKN